LGNGGHYFSSKERFMEYLAASRDRVDKAFKLLEKEGWIEREYVNPENAYEIRKKEFRSKDYRVFSHNEWNEKHPDKCCVKEPMPWDGEEQDKLCQDLWKFSKGKLKWYANQLAALRSFSTGELTLVDWLGTGAMLVQRSVFEKLAAAHPEWQTRNPSAEKLPGADKPYFHFFHIGINSETNNMLSEDLFFARPRGNWASKSSLCRTRLLPISEVSAI
jgi:hypothetical protein